VTLARRMWLASAALALLVGAAFTALILAVSAQREAADREARSKDVTAASLQLERLVSDIESSFLSFTVTAQEGSLDGYRDAGRKLPAQLRNLEELVRDDRLQSDRARALENQIREYVYFYVDALIPILRVEPGITEDDSTVAQNNNIYTDEIGRLFVAFRSAENKLAAQAAEDADQRTDLAVLVGAVAVGASMALIALFGIVLARSIGGPVRAVADGAGRIAGGELSYRLPQEGPG
jgi:CHASE3 domain sensor protein